MRYLGLYIFVDHVLSIISRIPIEGNWRTRTKPTTFGRPFSESSNKCDNRE